MHPVCLWLPSEMALESCKLQQSILFLTCQRQQKYSLWTVLFTLYSWHLVNTRFFFLIQPVSVVLYHFSDTVTTLHHSESILDECSGCSEVCADWHTALWQTFLEANAPEHFVVHPTLSLQGLLPALRLVAKEAFTISCSWWKPCISPKPVKEISKY